VVHAGRLARLAFEQDEFQGRLGDGEVGVAGAALGRLDAEQLGVEEDRVLQVSDPQSELNTRHAVVLSVR
jgi:uncharacterized membrane protein YeaQ/YmgE (transglycosylase-associated protein family)